MRRVLSIVLLSVALIGSSFMLTSANADHRGYHRSSDSFRLLAVSDQFKAIDVRPRGESIGDYIVFSDNLYQHRRKRAGYLDGTCTTTRLEGNAFRAQCLVTLSLRDGTLTSQGVLAGVEEDLDGFTIAITGGTGSYSDAAGEAHVRFISDEKTLISVVLE